MWTPDNQNNSEKVQQYRKNQKECVCFGFFLSWQRRRHGNQQFINQQFQHVFPPTGDSPLLTFPTWVLPKLLHHVSLPQGMVLQEQTASAWVTLREVLPAKLLQHEVLFPLVHRSCQEPPLTLISHRVTASFGYPPAPLCSPPRLQVDLCSVVSLSWEVRGQPAPLWSSPRAAGQSLLWHLQHLLLLLLLLHWPWYLQVCFSHIFTLHSPAETVNFFPSS